MGRRPEPEVLAPRVLRSSRLRTIGLLAGFAVFTAAGLLMVRAEADAGWLTVAFGLVGLSVFLFTLVRPNRLEVSAEGFTTVTLGRRWSVEWSRCGEFRAWRDYAPGSQSTVVFDCQAVESHPLAVLAVGLAGANSALPDTYGMSASDLAALLNRYRLAARAQEARPGGPA